MPSVAGPAARPAAQAPGALRLLAPLYAGTVALRGRLYASGLLRSHRLPVPVISVGNLTVGGSGKSPMVALIAARLAERGMRPAVVSRGYGGAHSGPATVVSEGAGPLVLARVAGDEPVMLARLLPGVPVIVSRRRRDGGELAVSRYGARCVVLDDGFQHRQLARDLDLLLLDGEDPFGNGRMLPAGPLREPVAAMARAGALVITRSDRSGPDALAAVAEASSRHCPRAPVFHARSAPLDLLDLSGGRVETPGRLRGARVVCFAGIASPGRFFGDIAAAGALVAESIGFPDHHRFADADLQSVAEAASRAGADLILTTEKDAVRLAGMEAAGRLPNLFAVRQRTAVDEAAQFDALLERAVS